MFFRHRPQGSNKHKDQPFAGLLRTENLRLEELADVLKAAVVDKKGERSVLHLNLRPPGVGPRELQEFRQ